MATLLKQWRDANDHQKAIFRFDRTITSAIPPAFTQTLGAIGAVDVVVVLGTDAIVTFDGVLSETEEIYVSDRGSDFITFDDASTIDETVNLIPPVHITAVKTATATTARIEFGQPLATLSSLGRTFAQSITGLTINGETVTLVDAQIGDSFCIVSAPAVAADMEYNFTATDGAMYWGDSFSVLDAITGLVEAGPAVYEWEGAGGSESGGSADWEFVAAPVAELPEIARAPRRIARRSRVIEWIGEGGTTSGGSADWEYISIKAIRRSEDEAMLESGELLELLL